MTPAQARAALNRIRCLDCGKRNPESYVLHNTVWRRIVDVKDRGRELCWECLGARLGRPPRYGDFRLTPLEMTCHFCLSTKAGYEAWKIVFPNMGRWMRHRTFRKLALGATTVEEFEKRLISYARSKYQLGQPTKGNDNG